MEQAARPMASSAVVLTVAGLVAVTPVTVSQLPDFQSRLIQLTAGGLPDLPGGFSDLFSNTQANATDLFDHFSFAPFPALQQVFANQIGNVENAISDPSSIGNIPGDIANNAQAAFGAPFEPFIPVAGSSPDVYSSLSTVPGSLDLSTSGGGLADILSFLGLPTSGEIPLPSHADLFNDLTSNPALLDSLSSALGLGSSTSDLSDLLNFTGSPASGVLFGLAGTFASPFLQLDSDFTQLTDAFTGSSPDISSAFTDLLNDPANVLNAFLNGYGPVDIASLSSTGLLGDLFGTQIGDALDKLASVQGDLTLNLGGLLSPGGSLFDALGAGATGTADIPLVGDITAALGLPGDNVGPLGSLIELGQAVAQSIGWDGTGNPLSSAFGDLGSGLDLGNLSDLGSGLDLSDLGGLL
jgi:hypothetical protein